MLALALSGAVAFSLSKAPAVRPCQCTGRQICMSEGEGGSAGITKSSTAAAAAVAELDDDLPLLGWGSRFMSREARENQLEAMFYQYDQDSSGDIDQEERA